MNNLNMYAIVRKNKNGKIEYRNFFINRWVSPDEFNLNCITIARIAEDFAKCNREVVKLKINVTEEKYD